MSSCVRVRDMIGAAETLTFNNIGKTRKEEKKPLSIEGGEIADAINLSGGGGCRCVLWSCAITVFALAAVVLVVVLVPQAPSPPPSPPPPSPPHPPSPPPNSPPRAPHTNVVSNGSPFAYSDVTGQMVTWTSLFANGDGWPLEVSELLYLDWSASSDGATSAGLGYMFQLHSGGSYTTITTGTMESTCRAHCANQASWTNSTGSAISDLCQTFTLLDQSAVAGINKIRCLFFRGGYPKLHPVSGSGLASGTLAYVYSLVPFDS